MKLPEKLSHKFLLLALMFLLGAGLAPADNWYVATNGSDSETGMTWTNAFLTITNAVTNAPDGDTVIVSNGTYTLSTQIVILKGITLKSLMGRDNTFLDGNYPATLNRCIYINHTNAVVDGFTITKGYAMAEGGISNHGGGVFISRGMLQNCVLLTNQAFYGGGISLMGGMVSNCLIGWNAATNSDSFGGGVYMGSNGVLCHSIISNNTASRGGGILINGGIFGVPAVVSNCEVSWNTASRSSLGIAGGGIYLSFTGLVVNSVVRGNVAYAGAGILIYRGGAVRNCLIVDNVSTGDSQYGGALYITNDFGIVQVPPTVENCTVVSNTSAYKAGGLLLWTANNTTNRFNNNIFYFNTTTGGVSYSNVTILGGGVRTFFSNCAWPSLNSLGSGNITNDPAFVDTNAGNYRLSTYSPCINQGTNIEWMTGTFDRDGNPRIDLLRVDMGAYEYLHPYPYLGVTPTNIINAIIRGRTARTLLTVTNAEGSNALTWMALPEGTWTYSSPTGGVTATWSGTNLWVTNSALTNLPGAYTENFRVVATNNYPLFDTLTTVVTFVMQVMELQKTPDQLTNAVVMQTSWTTNSFQLINAGPGVLNYTIATNQPWLVLSQSSGALTGATDAATNTIIVTYTNTAVLTVGEHNGTLSIVSTNGGGTTNTLAVTLMVNAVPMLGTTPAQLTNVVMAGQNASSQTIQVWNASANYGIGYRVTTNGTWLSVAVTNNFLAPLTTNRFTVTYAVSSLTQPGDTPSNYNGSITVTATNQAEGSPAVVPVSVRINPKPRLALSLTSLSPTVLQGQNAASQQYDIWNANGFYTLAYTNIKNASWLLPMPLNGTSTGEYARITVQYSTLNLLPGMSNAVITVVGRAFDGVNWDNAVNATQQIAVALTVSPLPTLATDAQSGYAYRTRKGLTPSNTVFHVWNGGQSPRSAMNYTSTPSVSWLSVTPKAGTSAGELDEVRVAVDPTGMNPWVLYSGTVQIDATDQGSGQIAYSSPQTFTIEVELYEVKGHDFQGGGSGASDLVVYREATGQWAIRNLLSTYATNLFFGGAGFLAMPADYSGDGVTELGLYRPGSGSWYAWQVGAESVQAIELNAWMGSGYVGVPGDYDGDGKVDPGVYLESSGLWMALLSGSSYQQASGILGGAGYAPLPSGDYDGDGRVDPGVYHRTSGLWIVFFSANSAVVSGTFGGGGFVLVPSDYDADSITDPAIYETASGRWYILFSTTLTSAGYGLAIYQIGGVVPSAFMVPAPGDYDGDGSADLALYDTTVGYWYIMTLSGAPLAWSYSLGGVGYSPVVP